MDRRSFVLRDDFVSRYITGDELPFSFTLGGKKANIRNIDVTRIDTDANCTNYYLRGLAGRQLEVTAAFCVYKSHPAVDYSVYIKNISDKNSSNVSKALGTDITFEGSNVRLWHSTGDYVSEKGYDSTIDKIGRKIAVMSKGRCCDSAFPYFRLLFEDHTVCMAVGWQAKWAAEFREKDRTVSVKAGQAMLDSYLEPGESFKLSSCTLLFCGGGDEEAINAWRRYFIDCVIPVPLGEKLAPMTSGSSCDSSLEFCFSTEESMLENFREYVKNDLIPDVWWIDAGWYDYNIGDEHKDWVRVGTWEVDTERFPGGIRPIADEVHKYGVKLLLWLEPERVHIRTKLHNEHPEYLLKSERDLYCDLLNLGDPEALKYITDHVNKLIKDNGVDIYREDFNFDPDLFFRDNEGPGRIGAAENHQCTGLLKFWDGLLEANPGLWIDSCASGGRRNDIETMKRSVPLHYSDFAYGDLPVKDAFQQTLFQWFPYFKENALSWNGDSEDLQHLAGLSAFCSLGCDFNKIYPGKKRADKTGAKFELHPEIKDEEAVERTHKYLGIWKIFSKYVYDDYFQFTKQSKNSDKWQIMQFAKADKSSGVIKALRFKDNRTASKTVKLRNIDPDATYKVTGLYRGGEKTVSGKKLSEGFTVKLEPGSGELFEYVKI